MKTIFSFLLIAVLIIALNKSVFAQENSVTLLLGNEILISVHNSIQEAYDDIPASIGEAYIIEILTVYTGEDEIFPINLTLKTGHSSKNTITIRPDAGNTGEVIGNVISTNGILNITNADYIIIDGRPGGTGTTADMIIRNTATTGANSNTITFIDGATNCAVRYCNIFNATQGSAGPRNIEFSTSAANTSGNSDNSIENCLISGGRSGVGCDGTLANPNRNIKILKNIITDFAFTGIWLLTAVANDYLIEGNTIDQVTGYNITNPTAINIGSTLSANVIIRKNKIVDVRSSSTSTALTIRSISTITAPSAGTILTIENNFISQTVNNANVASTYGILMTGSVNAYTANIFFNTILIGGTQITGTVNSIVSAGIVNNTTVATAVFNIKNNIAINTRSGGIAGVKHTAASYNNLSPVLNIDYNCYFATAPSDGYNAIVETVGYDDIISYKAAISPNEQSAKFKNVNFVLNTNLHLTGASIGDFDLAGTPIPGITTDIDEDTRSLTYPYKGADESIPLWILNLTAYLSSNTCPENFTVELRNAASPQTLANAQDILFSVSGIKKTASLNVPGNLTGSYYIVLKHWNSLETWSSVPVTPSTTSYDFTTGYVKAYCGNESGTPASIYRGDVNQDGVIDLDDVNLIYNDSYNFVIGNVPTDLNCDNIVDITDGGIIDNTIPFYPIVVSVATSIIPNSYVNSPGVPEYCDVRHSY